MTRNRMCGLMTAQIALLAAFAATLVVGCGDAPDIRSELDSPRRAEPVIPTVVEVIGPDSNAVDLVLGDWTGAPLEAMMRGVPSGPFDADAAGEQGDYRRELRGILQELRGIHNELRGIHFQMRMR